MDFSLPDEVERFRTEVREFLDLNLTDEVREAQHRSGDGHDRAFSAAMGAKRWVLAGWPREDGGAALDPLSYAVLWEELRVSGAPVTIVHATQHPASAVRHFGTEAQREAILPGVSRGETLICLGYTEPDSGSDAAAARTRAQPTENGWVINGAKMFTTGAHLADYVFLLARSNPGGKKHESLSTFLVPLRTPGIEVRAVQTMGGERTNAVFFEDVRIDGSALIGPPDKGWDVVRGALQSEHSGSGYYGARVRMMKAALAWARDPDQVTSRIDDPLVRCRLARVAMNTEIIRLLQLRSAVLRQSGRDAAVEGPITKLLSAETFQSDADLLLSMTGPSGLISEGEPGAMSLDYMYRYAPGIGIYGGTSEIMRSLIAERGLGLPRSR